MPRFKIKVILKNRSYTYDVAVTYPQKNKRKTLSGDSHPILCKC